MRPCQVVFVFTVVASFSSASAIPKPKDGEHKDRVVNKGLSDEKHFNEEKEHNPDYDHEAFLGREEAESFDDLSPEESQRRLGIIYDKIDRDHDGNVTEEELRDWIKHVQNRYIYHDTERQWAEHEPQGDTLTWEEYKKRTYGFMDEDDEDDEEEEGAGYSYKDMMRRDERRWNKADTNNDGALTKEEFANFLHPEDAEHMRDIVVEETIEDIDKDKDGIISVEEYIEDVGYVEDEDLTNHNMYDPEEEHLTKEDAMEIFNDHDVNKNGIWEVEEYQSYLRDQEEEITVEQETEHLLTEADANEDGFLTREEVLDKYDLFVGSQATDFGEALTRHDEF